MLVPWGRWTSIQVLKRAEKRRRRENGRVEYCAIEISYYDSDDRSPCGEVTDAQLDSSGGLPGIAIVQPCHQHSSAAMNYMQTGAAGGGGRASIKLDWGVLRDGSAAHY